MRVANEMTHEELVEQGWGVSATFPKDRYRMVETDDGYDLYTHRDNLGGH